MRKTGVMMDVNLTEQYLSWGRDRGAVALSLATTFDGHSSIRCWAVQGRLCTFGWNSVSLHLGDNRHWFLGHCLIRSGEVPLYYLSWLIFHLEQYGSRSGQ